MTGSTVFNEEALRVVRRAYAKQMLALAEAADNQALEDAFATVRREAFIGDPPWRVLSMHAGGYFPLPSSDPVLLYQNINLALAPERGVNNGSPALHASWLHRAALRRGDRVAHIGAGTGYYTAIIANLVGEEGHVLAVEFDPKLAELAKRHLDHLANITVVQGDGGAWPEAAVDAVYVNFMVQRPSPAWIMGLKPGGRLIFPLGVRRPKPSPTGGYHTLYGAGLRVERMDRGYAAQWLGPAYFVFAEGSLAGSPDDRDALKSAFERGGIEFVRSLLWQQPPSPNRCWYVGKDWSLCFDEPA